MAQPILKSIGLFILQTCLVFIYDLQAITPIPYTRSEEYLEEYYELVQSIRSKSATEQVLALQSFVEKHTRFTRGHRKLLERYLYFKKNQ